MSRDPERPSSLRAAGRYVIQRPGGRWGDWGRVAMIRAGFVMVIGGGAVLKIWAFLTAVGL